MSFDCTYCYGISSRHLLKLRLLSGSSDFFPLPGDLLAQSHFLRNFLRDTSEERVKVYLYEKRHMSCGSKTSWTIKVLPLAGNRSHFVTYDQVPPRRIRDKEALIG